MNDLTHDEQVDIIIDELDDELWVCIHLDVVHHSLVHLAKIPRDMISNHLQYSYRRTVCEQYFNREHGLDMWLAYPLLREYHPYCQTEDYSFTIRTDSPHHDTSKITYCPKCFAWYERNTHIIDPYSLHHPSHPHPEL